MGAIVKIYTMPIMEVVQMLQRGNACMEDPVYYLVVQNVNMDARELLRGEYEMPALLEKWFPSPHWIADKV